MKSRPVRALAFLVLALSAPPALLAQQRVQLPARDNVLTETPATVFSIGRASGEHWEELVQVRGAAFDARDNLYVLDAGNYRVLVFDASGKFVRAVGKRGEGPGELMGPAAMVVSPQGTIVVADVNRRAFSLFGSDGAFLRNVPFPEGQGMGLTAPTLYVHPQSGVVAQTFVPPGQGRDATGERRAPVLWFDFPLSTGSASSTQSVQPRTLFEFRLPSITRQVQTEGGRVTGVSTMPANWEPPYGFGVLPDGALAVVREAAYRVQIVAATGAVQRVYERAIAPRRGTDADKERYVRVRSEEIPMMQLPRDGNSTGAAVDPALIEDRVRNAQWMELIPVLRGVRTDPTGHIWVARTPADFGLTGPIDLLRADGSYIGTVSRLALPAAISASGRAAFIEKDPLGVERVTVRRTPASWR